MAVEIYDEREINSATLSKEPDDEAIALINELGLKAQLTDSGSRLAYPTPTEDQCFVMEVLFPSATKLEEYNAGAIPLRVLKEIRSYRAENPTHILVVRHCTPVEVKDPILLAWHGDRQHSWLATQRTGQFAQTKLIARWGDALDSWESLVAKASEVATKNMDNAMQEIISKCEGMRASIARGIKVRKSQVPSLHMDPF